ncbi:putative lipid II flippase FtsW [Tumebacillus flagellatus]|uniref:Probable peptidoglycan glycosyltransferase FtsW n=1 Tax=Tumebacillus flagellatus TaxID=1157490 RepID=A0A074LQP9_9BACL|nr:putative lipid II flippase FtsW [Tumebacillus flagellatus]KEO82123.1 hypothetical protein EL26_17010 [Tumebacillus flagellatus]
MKVTRHRPDFVLFLVVILLAMIGLVAVYSASAIYAYKMQDTPNYYFLRQLMFFVIGTFGMLFAMNTHYQMWYKLSRPMLLVTYLLLVMVFVPGVGMNVNGAYRWISLGPFSFQPTEIAMITINLYLAYLLTKKGDRVSDPKASFWPSVILVVIGFGLIILEPDMDTAITFAGGPFLIMFVAGVPWKHLRNTMLLAIITSVPLALMGYRGDRIWAYLDPFKHMDGDGYQIVQSLFAISTGGWTGRGLGHSIEKFSYLPEAHTDFIFAIFSEEWGLIGGLFLIVLYGVVIWRGIHIALNVQDKFAQLVAIGITSVIAMAVFFNIGSVSGLLPVIGVPLPFISYGGTSLVFKLFMMGILLNISRYTARPEEIALLPSSAPRIKHGANIDLKTSRFDA